MNKIFKSQSGASVVEFAFVLPLLLVIVFGIVEFGTLLYNQQLITNASREGARAGIVARVPRLLDYGNPSIDKVVQTYCSNYLITFGSTNSPPTTSFVGYASDALFGTDLKVTVNYTFEFLVIPNFVPGINKLRTMKAETLMKYE
jgi:Flp pilus assembly protein TadG